MRLRGRKKHYRSSRIAARPQPFSPLGSLCNKPKTSGDGIARDGSRNVRSPWRCPPPALSPVQYCPSSVHDSAAEWGRSRDVHIQMPSVQRLRFLPSARQQISPLVNERGCTIGPVGLTVTDLSGFHLSHKSLSLASRSWGSWWLLIRYSNSPFAIRILR